VFLGDFNGYGFDMINYIFADGTEGELVLGRESHFTHIHGGPYRVLLDKKGILGGVVFPWYEPAQAEQIQTLHHLIYWFWHDLSHHFITAMARGQIWSAYGALEALRITCVNLVRLRQNFQAALVIVRFYQELAPPLAQAHGITYPADLERVVYDRLEQLCNRQN
jgi:hypothetical protein